MASVQRRSYLPRDLLFQSVPWRGSVRDRTGERTHARSAIGHRPVHFLQHLRSLRAGYPGQLQSIKAAGDGKPVICDFDGLCRSQQLDRL